MTQESSTIQNYIDKIKDISGSVNKDQVEPEISDSYYDILCHMSASLEVVVDEVTHMMAKWEAKINCNHEKVYEFDVTYPTDPPSQNWICRLCLQEGRDSQFPERTLSEYEVLERRILDGE